VTNVSIPGTDAELLLMTLDLKGIQASGGSACQSGSVGHSHVLEAMGVPQELAASAMRLSVGALTDEAAIAHAAEVIVTVARKARGLVPA
jgi:cysteine desulfurase